MRASYITAFLIVLSSSPAFSQQPNSFQGKWAGSMQGRDGGELAVELVVNEAGGTWRFISAKSRNPCIGKEFPITLTTRSATELGFEINGSKVLQGCIDQPALLKSTDSKILEGALQDGRAVKLVRQ